MKRLDVLYNGQPYIISNRELGEVEEQIIHALQSGVPSWLEVNVGEGSPHTARLLIHPGIGISLSPVSVDDEQAPEYPHEPIDGTHHENRDHYMI